MNTFSFPVNTIIKKFLNKDFSDALSRQIIIRNSKKCSLNLAHLDSDSYFRLVDAIISDYENIKPLGGYNAFLKKRELLSAIETMH